MTFFRNLSLFRFTPAVATDLARLEKALSDHGLRPCEPLEMTTRGFVSPVGRGDGWPMILSAGDCTLFTIGSEEKLLPAAVINNELSRKLHKISMDEGRKVGGRERKRMRDDLLTELLPRAFVRSTRLSAYVDKASGWLVADTSSRRSAENCITQVREALGSFPAVPLAPEEGPRVVMTDWLANGTLPEGLSLGDECELRDPSTADGAISRSRRQDLDAEEIKEHLRNGKQVFQLGLVFEDRIYFVLGQDLTIHRLKFLDTVMEKLGDTSRDETEEMQSRFTLMTLELGRLLEQLAQWFAIPQPKDA